METMIKIYQTNNFLVFTLKKPHISREDGGHIVIAPTEKVLDRTQLSARKAIELMRLTMIVGEAMARVLNEHGVDVGRVNYQDNGNWGVLKPEGPNLHVHLYGRAKSAKIQKWGESCNFPKPETGFYDSFQSLNDEDIREIKSEVERLLATEKYQDRYWYL